MSATYDKKTFHRDFETKAGWIKVEDFPPIDYSIKDQIEMLFPPYRREYLKLSRAQLKDAKGAIEIDNFDLKTPDNARYLFKGTKLYLEPHKRCAMYGQNGSGKTTLFEAIIALEVDSFPKHLHVHHMKELEHNPAADDVSVIDTVLCSHPWRRVLLPIEEEIKAQLEKETDGDRKCRLQDNLTYVEFALRSLKSDTGVKRASEMLRVLGFDDNGFVQPLSSLSGGLRMRVALASAFFIDPELLLLDEPTNHLDMPSVLWLENRLRAYKGSYLLVTHDRTLLENVVTSVMLLQDEKIEYFACGFKEFEKRKIKMDIERDQKIDKFLMANRRMDPSSPQYRIKVAYKAWQTKRQERLVQLAGKFNFKPPKALKCPPGMEQKDVPLITVTDVRFSYNEEKGLPFIFDNPISHQVTMATRLGVMGPNGAGKSTFLKLITNKLQPAPGRGTITINPNYTLAYFGQHSTKELKMDMTAKEFMIASFPKEKEGLLTFHLEKTSIVGDTANTRMLNLSFSQRSCVIFAKLTYVPPHLLIMDEPTNFLDLESVDSLIKAANAFSGGLITVTHNRDFLKRTSKKFLSIIPGGFNTYSTMKDAERATYSFITALEEGKQIDVKNAINNNRGGGAKHTDEYLAGQAKRLAAQGSAEAAKAAAAAAEAKAAADAVAAHEAKMLAKKNAIKLDWVAGDKCFVLQGKNTWIEGVVIRNVPRMGVTVEYNGNTKMLDVKKLRVENPNPGGASGGRGGGRGGRGGRGGARGGGRGGARGGAGGRGGRGGRGGARGGGRGGARGGRGGARGGGRGRR